MARHVSLSVLAFVAAASLALPVVQTGVASASTTWQTEYAATGETSFTSVSCATATICTAVGGGESGYAAVYRTTDGGGSWDYEAVPAAAPNFTSVSCPTVEFCLATAPESIPTVYPTFVYATTDGGATWGQVGDFESTTGTLTGLDCVTTSVCFALEGNDASEALAVSKDGGVDWQVLTGRDDVSALGESCPTMTCFTVGWGSSSSNVAPFVIEEWTPSGSVRTVFSHEWPLPSSGQPPSISCTTTKTCIAVGAGAAGALVLTTTTGGATWHVRRMPAKLTSAVSVSCAPGARCGIEYERAGAVNEAVTSIGDRTWSTRPIAHAAHGGQITCPLVESCIAVVGDPGGEGLRWQSSPEGFSPADIVAGPNRMTAVACPTDEECLAVGYGSSLLSTDGGASWTQVTDGLGPSDALQAVACATPTDCVAVGGLATDTGLVGVAYWTIDGGERWVRATTPAGSTPLESVACPSSSLCVAVASAPEPILVSTDAGATWTVPSVPSDSSASFDAVSCGTPTTCVAVGGPTVGMTSDAGSSWTYVRPVLTGENPLMESVSCSSSADCVAVAATYGSETYTIGYAFGSTDGGTSWTELSMLPGGGVPAISCSGENCFAISTDSFFDPAQSTLSSSADGAASWSAMPLPSPDVLLSGVASMPDGQIVIVGSDSANGALVISN